MLRGLFHILATTAVLATANVLPAEESRANSAASSPWMAEARGSDESCADFGAATETAAELSLPASGFRAPSYLLATQGLLGYSENSIALLPSCFDRSCGVGVIIGYASKGLGPARFEFRLIGAPADAQVTVGLLNSTTNQFDLFTVEVRRADVGLLYTATALPVDKDIYQHCGWVEIGIHISHQFAENPLACPTCGTDAISIRDVTLGPM